MDIGYEMVIVHKSEAYSEFSQTSNMEIIAKTVNSFNQWTGFYMIKTSVMKQLMTISTFTLFKK